MSKETLSETLLQLHQNLADQPVIAEDERALLQELVGEIQHIINNDVPVDKSVATRIETECVDLEAEYPALGGTLRQIVDVLGSMGV